MGIVWRTLINAVAIVVAAYVVNAIVKPILVMVSLPITCVTLGLFIFVINALMLLLVSLIPFLGFVVNGFVVALVASIVISIVSWALSMVLPD